jgi:isochorismate synthase
VTTTITAAPTAADLLARYGTASPFFFSSPRGTLLADGTYFAVPRSVRADCLRDLPGRVAAVLDVARAAGHEDPVVVGAVPFDPGAQARLSVPERILRSGRLPEDLPAGPVPARIGTVTPVPAEDVYADGVRRAVARMRAGEFTKVVLARTLELTTDAEVDPAAVLRRLAARNPRGHTFATDLGDGRTLVGASPELLVSRTGDTVTANPIAGSIARSADPAEDRRRARALRVSAKDLAEHAVVVDAVVAALTPLCGPLAVPAGPELVATPAMWHLSTVITGPVAGPHVSALALACALHPTPAVCGTPEPAARAVIAESEAFDRGFYTGMVGWGDAAGDGEWVVTIRCAQTEGRTLRLYAGAGIVADSDPHAELTETSAKFRTMLDGLGL